MATKIVYIINDGPAEKAESVSAALGQALTAQSFDYGCELYLMGDGINLARKGALAGIRSRPFEPLQELLENYLEMGGRLYVCIPAMEARGLEESDFLAGTEFVNASVLINSGVEADAVFTF